MNDEAIRRHIVEAARAIAPETDAARIDPARSLREQLELDSFDLLRLLVDLQARLGVEIPEADYGRIDSLDRLVAYVAERITPSRPGAAPTAP